MGEINIRVNWSGDRRTEEILLVILKWIGQHLYITHHCLSILLPVFYVLLQILAMQYVFFPPIHNRNYIIEECIADLANYDLDFARKESYY